ncbi:jg3768 [Pararge aegeria aegeria]|uniref:Jg3768 protein n=1 Tax=Pararge aegeria aegeria TaxID=348720 RepID=A0A8S4QU38_9NEOP|nr:jg3768 [Pararge aegeria aegeria]
MSRRNRLGVSLPYSLTGPKFAAKSQRFYRSSSESPGKSSCSNFQMAPGGERRKPDPWPKDDNLDDLERRLKNLRGFNS